MSYAGFWVTRRSGGEERLGLHLDSLREKLPGTRTQDAGQGIIDLVGLTKPDNTAILFHGVSLSLRGSGRLDTRLDTPPILYRHHPVSRLALNGQLTVTKIDKAK